ncbi:MAG: hypothetical protein M1308_21765 [Actinobacteria bacterium]|nr:hypothetical protein [Actinomycetota bacterium]
MNIEKLKTHGKKRSKEWPEARKNWLKVHPKCFVCLGKEKVQVHHVIAFHTDETKELDPKNFITLCEGMNRNCHRLFGHLDNYQSINENVREDAKFWRQKILHRPKWNGKMCKWEYIGKSKKNTLKKGKPMENRENY